MAKVNTNIQLSRQAMWGAYATAAIVAVTVGCDLPGQPNPDDRPKAPSQIVSFEPLFASNCAGCHGADGQLGPAPPLNDPLFLAIVSDAELTTVIRDGRSGTPMPPFAQSRGGELTDEQIEVLVTGLKAQWGDHAMAADSLPAYALTKTEGVQSTPGSRERGEEVFGRACAGCHGAQGKGIEDGGTMHYVVNDWAFLALISDQALRRIIITGRPDLGMPNYAHNDGRPEDFQPLTAAEIDDLVALLADWRATGSIDKQTAAQP